MFSGPHGLSAGLGWNTSWYATPGQGGFGTTNVGDALPAEARRRHYIYTDGTIYTMAARRDGSTSGVSDTVYLRVNSGDTILAITSTDNGAVTPDTDSVAVASGNYLTFRHTNSDPCYVWIRMLFEPTADNTQVTRYCGTSVSTVFSTSTSAAMYFSWTGRLNSNSTEAQSQIKVKIAGTFRNVRVWVFRNRSTSTVTIRSRKNGAYGNVSISVPAGSGTGYFTNVGVYGDFSNTDTVAVDDNYCFEASASTGNVIDFTVVDVDFSPTTVNGDHELFLANDGGITVSASASSQFFPPGGGLSTSAAADSDVNATFGMTCGARMFRAKVRTNTCNTNQTCVVMKNNVATALTFDITAATTGEFVDSSNSISLNSTDTVSIRVTGGGTGSMILQYFAMIIPGATAAAGGTVRTYGQIFGF